MMWFKKIIPILLFVWNGLADLFYVMVIVLITYLTYSYLNDSALLEIAPFIFGLFYITFIPFLVRTAKSIAE